MSNRNFPGRVASARVVAAIGALTFAIAIGPMSTNTTSTTTQAAAPSRLLCSDNSAFCGTVLRVDSSNGMIPSVAAGAHYGPEWGIPASPNDADGTGWCVDDTHTGYPAGPIVEQPLPEQWTQRQRRVAAAIISLYGGDRVLPYQSLEVDEAGELVDAAGGATNPTRQRHVAVWLALRSVLPDPAGTPRIHLGSARTFTDIAGRRPSAIGNPAVPLALEMVRHAEAVAPQGDVDMTIEFESAGPPTDVTQTREVHVRLTDTSSRPLPALPVWPSTISNAVVAPASLPSHHSDTTIHNVERSGWLSFDASQHRAGATLTDADGVATFLIEIDTPAAWNVGFTTETPPQEIRLFGDDIRAQNNVTLDDAPPVLTSAAISGDLTRRSVRVVKTSTDPRFDVTGAVFALIDGDGDEIDRGTSHAAGIIDFAPFDDADHPPPYTARELAAPPGLQRLASDVFVALDPAALSSDPDAPTTIEIPNDPIAVEAIIAKTISGAAGAPTDLSGFEFGVRRAGTDTPIGRMTTGIDGRTPPLSVPPGDYVIDEVARPDWWPPDDPVSAAVEAKVSEAARGDALVIEFDNTLPEPTVSTFATDASDGDKLLTIIDPTLDGSSIVDRVDVCGLVDGSSYRVDGELVAVFPDGMSERTTITSSAELPADLDDAGCVTVDLTFDIPADSIWLAEGNRLVVTNRISTEDSTVALHHDLDSIEQSVTVERIIPPPTTAPPTTAPAAPQPTTTAPTTTTTTAAPATTTTLPPTTTAPPPSTTSAPVPAEPSLPRTGGEEWRMLYRSASWIVFAGALLFFASTLGLGHAAMTRDRSRRDPSRSPGTHTTRTNDEPEEHGR